MVRGEKIGLVKHIFIHELLNQQRAFVVLDMVDDQ